MCVTTPSTWPWIAHLVSGLRLTTLSLCSNSLSLRLPYSVKLAAKRKSLTHYAKGTQSPDKTGSYCLYVCGFRFYFTPLPGFFSPFLHSTGSLSVDHEYLALEDGPPIFRQDVTCPALLIGSLVPHTRFRVRGHHPLWQAFPDLSAVEHAIGALGCCDFARRYFRNLG